MPKIIVKSEYVTSLSHILNALTYAGEKLEAQTLITTEGELLETNPDKLLTREELSKTEFVKIKLKDGSSRTLTPEQYIEKILEEQKAVTTYTITNDKGEVEEHNIKDPDYYLDYIAHRPHVELNPSCSHGLFDMNGAVDIGKAKEMAAIHKNSIFWSEIISLTRGDAERTGYDNRKAWENLIRIKADDIAKIYNISRENLVVNAAYHDKEEHPHVHMYFYSTNKNEGFIKGGDEGMKKATSKLKSKFFNEIFRDDVSYLKEVKNEQENTLKNKLNELTRKISNRDYEPPAEVEEKMTELFDELQSKGVKGRLYYAYQAPEIKQKIQEVLEVSVKQDKYLSKSYEEYINTYQQLVEQYMDSTEKIENKMAEIKNTFFNPGKTDNKELHNLILRNAVKYNSVINKKIKGEKKEDKKQLGQIVPDEKAESEKTNKKEDDKDVGQNVPTKEDLERYADFKKDLLKEMKNIYLVSSDDKQTKFAYQKLVDFVKTDLSKYEFQTYDKLPEQYKNKCVDFIKATIESNKKLNETYDKLTEAFPESELLATHCEQNRKNDKSLLNLVPFLSTLEDVKLYKWQKENKYNKDVSKKIYSVVSKTFEEDTEFNHSLREKLYSVKKNNMKSKELLKWLYDNSKDIALEVECMFNENKNVIKENAYDNEQNGKKYSEILRNKFFNPDTYDYKSAHLLLENLSNKVDAFKYNRRLNQCETRKLFNKEVFSSVWEIYNADFKGESLSLEELNYNNFMKAKFENLYNMIKQDKALMLSELPPKKNELGQIVPTSEKDLKVFFNTAEDETKRATIDIIKTMMSYNTKLQGYYNDIKSEYKKVVEDKRLEGDTTLPEMLKELDEVFFSPKDGYSSSAHNIIYKFAEDLHNNKIRAECETKERELQKQRFIENAKKEQFKKACVQATIYLLCKAINSQTVDNNIYSESGKHRHRNRNISHEQGVEQRSDLEQKQKNNTIEY